MTKLIIILLIIFAGLFAAYHFGLLKLVSHSTTSCPELTGKVVYRQDANYNKSRLVSNYYTSKNKYPEVVVYCQNAQDVQNAVKWARCKNIPIRIRSGGHHHEGYSTGNDVIVIDVGQMKDLQIDKKTNIATAQPGLNNDELYTKLAKQGYTHVGGTCGEVSLSGLILTGGMGPLLRRVGLGCDALVSFDMVDAKGNIIHATKDNEHKDLFWATQGGGGGNFGIIVSIDIKVYPAEDVTWFNIGWDWDSPVDRVFSEWQNFFVKQDRKWFSHLDLWGKSFATEKLKKHPIKALGFFWGTPEQAREQLAPLLGVGKPKEEIFERVNWQKAIKALVDSTAVFLTDKPEYKSSGAFVMDKLPKEAIDITVNTLRDSNSPLLNVLLFSMGGATADVAPTATAYYYRKANFFINYTSQWLKEDEDSKYKIELKTLRERLLPYTVGDYVGNPDPDLKDYLKDYYGENVAKLECVKRKYDPENIFKFEQSIHPAAEPCK